MLSIAPAEDIEDLVVDAHWDGEAHDSEGDGGDHGDDVELEQRQQAHHQARQHHARPLRVLPVDQVHYCNTGREEEDEESESAE